MAKPSLFFCVCVLSVWDRENAMVVTRMEKGEIITLSRALLKFVWPFVCPCLSLLAIYSTQAFAARLSVKV